MTDIKIEFAHRRYLPQILEMTMQTQIEHADRQPDQFSKTQLEPSLLKFYRSSFRRWGFLPAFASQRVIAAVQGDHLVGYIALKFRRVRRSIVWSATIYDIRVDAAFQGQGVGRRLVDFATTVAKDRGCFMMYAHIWHDNIRSARLFSSCGFEEHYSLYGLSLMETDDGG
ncbi:GNAT family N-acetyltransferase [Pseudaestuariivita rosea]|uniref:GNAT family N-acetyltransferase n=1 Tax=Pseudaestuariivita rosea TaxID=2763263 RepID=UPI001ABBA881|nr:GNAT family N-acetyltransferase [Pseudaestuariivita rosea]